GLVHGPEHEADAAAPREERHEGVDRLPGSPERTIHEMEARADVEDRLVRERRALGLGRGEGLEDLEGSALSLRGRAAHAEHPVLHRVSLAGARAPQAEERARRGPEVAQHEGPVEAVELTGAAVVLAHEELRAEQPSLGPEAERGREVGLEVEGQEVRL